jgi:hypothetical protein
MAIARRARFRSRLRNLSAGALLLSCCSKPPPPVAYLPPDASAPMAAVVVATQATLMQARYGCTMFGCRHGFECDKISKLCRPLSERPAAPAHAAPAAPKPCVGSTSGLFALCTQAVAEGSFQIRAENVGPKAIVLSLRELSARCSAAGAPSTAQPVVKALGLRFLATGRATPNDPREALFLSPGPPADLEVLFEGATTSECAVELKATFAVEDALLQLTGTLP